MRSKGRDDNFGEEGWLWHIQELEEGKMQNKFKNNESRE